MQSGKEGKIKGECWSVCSVERMDQRNKSMVRRIPSGEDEHHEWGISDKAISEYSWLPVPSRSLPNLDYYSFPGHQQISNNYSFEKSKRKSQNIWIFLSKIEESNVTVHKTIKMGIKSYEMDIYKKKER